MTGMLTTIMQYAGALATASFVLIALGDFVTGVINTIIQKLIVPQNTTLAQKIVFYWGLIDEIYDEFRTFLNRLSLYTRPRPALSSKGLNGREKGPDTVTAKDK